MAKRVTVQVYGQKIRVKPKQAKRIRSRKQTVQGALYNPTAMLTGPSLRSAAQQLTDLQIQPQLSAIDRASSLASRQGTALANRSASYYQQLAGEAQSGIARQQAITQRTVGNIATAGTEEQNRLNSADQMVSGDQANDSVVRGTGLQFGDRAKEELAAAKAAAAQRTGTAETAANQYGGNFADIQNAMAGTMALRGGEQQNLLANQLANQQAQYRGQRQDIQSTRGNALTKNILDLRSTGFENYAVQQGLFGDQMKIQADAQQQRASQRQDLKKLRISNNAALQRIRLQDKLDRKGKLSPKEQANLDLLRSGIDPATHKRIPYPKGRGGSGSGSGSKNKPTAGQVSDRNEAYDAIGQIVAAHSKNAPKGLQGRIELANRLKKGQAAIPAQEGPGGTKTKARAEIPPLPPAVVKAAMDIIYDQHISKATRQALRSRYPGLYRQLIKSGYKGPGGARSGVPRIGGPAFSGPRR
jgi:hypothetical protein